MASVFDIDRSTISRVRYSESWGATLVVPLRRELFSDVVDSDVGMVGVAMCMLPLDISLRAYAIEAMSRVVRDHGLMLAGRRDASLASGKVDMHFAQFIVTSPSARDEAGFEAHLGLVHEEIEREWASMGLDDEASVVSCSCRSITYPSLDGNTTPESIYSDLAGSIRERSARPEA